MEAVVIAGVAVVAAGGFYAALDFLKDIGIRVHRAEKSEKESSLFVRSGYLPKERVKKMAGVYI